MEHDLNGLGESNLAGLWNRTCGTSWDIGETGFVGRCENNLGAFTKTLKGPMLGNSSRAGLWHRSEFGPVQTEFRTMPSQKEQGPSKGWERHGRAWVHEGQ